MTNVTLNAGAGGAVMATEQNASAPNENYQIIEVASGAGSAFANRLTITAAGAAKIDASGTVIQANAGTNLNTSALALESGGNLAALLARLPATAALADATANPTLSALQSFLMGFNGTTWDRLKATAGSLNVHLDSQTLTTNATIQNASIAVTGTFFQATQPVSGTVTANAGTGTFTNQQSNKTADYDTGAGTDTVTMFGVALPASGGAVAGGTSSNPLRVDPTGTTTQPVSGTVTVQQSTASNLKVDLSGTAANATALKVDGSAVTQPVSGTISANQSGTWNVGLNSGTNTIGDVNLTAAAQGGYSVSSQTSLTTTATVSSAAGKFGGFMFSNVNSTPAYIQVFDTTGAVTLGTTTPTFVIPIPANATAANGAAAVHEFSVGIAIANGIKVAATTTATGSTTVTTGLTGFVMFK